MDRFTRQEGTQYWRRTGSGDTSLVCGGLALEIPTRGHATGYTRRWSTLGLFLGVCADAKGLRSNEGAWMRYRAFHLNGGAHGGLKGNALGWSSYVQ